MRRRSTGSWYARFLVAVLLATPQLAYAVDDIFVRVNGIDGDSQQKDHERRIQAYALGNSVSAVDTSPAGSGHPVFRTTFSDLSILKRIDRASPKLFLTAAMNQQLQTVDVDFVRRGQEPFTYFKMRLSDVIITGVRTNANSTDESITEFVTLHYRRISWEYTIQKDDGSKGDTVSGCWNLDENSPC